MLRLALFTILYFIGDTLTTLALHSAGIGFEANPLVASILDNTTLFIAFKLLAFLIVIPLLLWLRKHEKATYNKTTALLILFSLFVVVNNTLGIVNMWRWEL